MSPARRIGSLVVALCAVVGCGTRDEAVDPDGHAHESRAQLSPLPDVAIDEVVGAVAGVPRGDAAQTLERWLRGTPNGDRVLADWPRNKDGSLDVERAPLRLVALDASIGPGSKSKCGDISAVFSGDARVALRMHLSIPGTTKECRGLFRASRVTNGEATPLLRAAIADARVPDNLEAPAVAQN